MWSPHIHWDTVFALAALIAFVFIILMGLWSDSRWTENCPHCGAKKTTPSSMRRHIRIMHKEH